VYYLIQHTTRGERVLFQGQRPLLLNVARVLRRRCPRFMVRVTRRPADLAGNPLLPQVAVRPPVPLRSTRAALLEPRPELV
jgi:hypothetical protein